MFWKIFRFVIFCLQIWKVAEVKKTKRLTHDEIRLKLIEFPVMNDTIETDNFNKKVEEAEDPEKTA